MRTMFLAAALTLTACDSQQPKTLDEINQLVRLSDAAMGVAEKVSKGAPTADVHGAMGEMNVALDTARKQINAIVRRVSIAKSQGDGSIDPRDISACIDGSLSTAASIEEMPMDTLTRG